MGMPIGSDLAELLKAEVRKASEPAQEAVGQQNAIAGGAETIKATLGAVVEALGQIATQLQMAETTSQGFAQAAEGSQQNASNVRAIISGALNNSIPGADALLSSTANLQEQTMSTQSQANLATVQEGTFSQRVSGLENELRGWLDSTKQLKEQSEAARVTGKTVVEQVQNFNISVTP